jgi:hypothetical protein
VTDKPEGEVDAVGESALPVYVCVMLLNVTVAMALFTVRLTLKEAVVYLAEFVGVNTTDRVWVPADRTAPRLECRCKCQLRSFRPRLRWHPAGLNSAAFRK